jgi:hypothetical protein
VAVGEPIDGAVAVIDLHDGGDPIVRHLVENTVLELAACELWRRRIATGRMP